MKSEKSEERKNRESDGKRGEKASEEKYEK